MAKILVVDDEEDIPQVVTITLEAHGHDVQSAKDGKKALDMVAKHHPDLIVLDVMMPKMNGLQVVEALHADAETKDIPILMLTATTQYALKPDEYWRERVGVQDYITKPFEPRDLLNRVEALV